MTAVYGIAAALGVLRAAHTAVLVLFAAAAVFCAIGLAEYVLWVAVVDGYRWLRARKHGRMRREATRSKR